MFDKNFSYDKNEIDLMQLINEFMLKTTFEIFDFINISRIKKLESDFDEKFIINQSTRAFNQKINKSIKFHLIKIFFRHQILRSIQKILKILIFF